MSVRDSVRFEFMVSQVRAACDKALGKVEADLKAKESEVEALDQRPVVNLTDTQMQEHWKQVREVGSSVLALRRRRSELARWQRRLAATNDGEMELDGEDIDFFFLGYTP